MPYKAENLCISHKLLLALEADVQTHTQTQHTHTHTHTQTHTHTHAYLLWDRSNFKITRHPPGLTNTGCKVEPNMLKNLPNNPSRTSQKVYLHIGLILFP